MVAIGRPGCKPWPPAKRTGTDLLHRPARPLRAPRSIASVEETSRWRFGEKERGGEIAEALRSPEQAAWRYRVDSRELARVSAGPRRAHSTIGWDHRAMMAGGQAIERIGGTAEQDVFRHPCQMTQVAAGQTSDGWRAAGDQPTTVRSLARRGRGPPPPTLDAARSVRRVCRRSPTD